MKKIAILLLVSALVVSCGTERSLMASVAETYLRCINVKQRFADSLTLYKNLDICARTNDELPKLPGMQSEVRMELFTTPGVAFRMPVYQILPKDPNGKCVFYLHGGGYINQALSVHWRALDKLAHNTKTCIVAPAYPLAPAHTWEEAFPLLEGLYRQLLETYKPEDITIMGDSAGGGLSAAMCLHFAQVGLPQPRQAILLSPWVDTTTTNPDIPALDSVDPMLSPPGLPVCARAWAGEPYDRFSEPVTADSKLWDWHISPMYGDLSVLKNVTIFTGTRELLYPDAVIFNQKLQEAGVDSRIIISEGGNHVYPFYPTPEGRRAFRDICEMI